MCTPAGMAGAGKTTLIQQINSYMSREKINGYLINLDPAVMKLPYEPHIDIRDTVLLPIASTQNTSCKLLTSCQLHLQNTSCKLRLLRVCIMHTPSTVCKSRHLIISSAARLAD